MYIRVIEMNAMGDMESQVGKIDSGLLQTFHKQTQSSSITVQLTALLSSVICPTSGEEWDYKIEVEYQPDTEYLSEEAFSDYLIQYSNYSFSQEVMTTLLQEDIATVLGSNDVFIDINRINDNKRPGLEITKDTWTGVYGDG